jgi:hypothetical protein
MTTTGEVKGRGRPLTREDYRPNLPIVSKHGRKAVVQTPCFHVLGVDSGWWCRQINYRYSKRWSATRTRHSGFLLRYEEFKDWYVQED